MKKTTHIQINSRLHYLFCWFLLIGVLPTVWGQSSSPISRLQVGIDVLHYTFSLKVSDQKTAIEGEATLLIHLSSGHPDTLKLDLIGQGKKNTGMQVLACQAGPRKLPFYQTATQLLLPLPPDTGDTLQLTITYRGTPADGLFIARNRYGDPTFFGDNWPDRARHWLPTVDDPADKAQVRWEIEAPAHYQVIANGSLLGRKDIRPGWALTEYESSHPLATKIMVIGVAPFVVQPLGTDKGIAVTGWVYPQQQVPALRDLAPALPILRWMSDNIGPFPYAKIAHVQSTTRYGGMENAGNIFYDENAFTGAGKLETLIAHEMAHQWFGDAVTEASWPHIWLSEGFADYFAELYREARYGPDSLRAGMARARERVLAQGPMEPLVDSVYAHPQELLNANSYEKGAWVLHMLRTKIGDGAFWPGIRRYYAIYAHKNASTADFQAIMEEASGQSLSDFFASWVHQIGHPVLGGDWTYNAATGEVKLFLLQQQERLFAVPLEVVVHDVAGNMIGRETFWIDEKREVLHLRLRKTPHSIRLDPRVRLLFDNRWTTAH